MFIAHLSVFVERNALMTLLKLVRNVNRRELVIQIIQSLGLFLYNIEKPEHISTDLL